MGEICQTRIQVSDVLCTISLLELSCVHRLQGIFYISKVIFMTLALVLAARKTDPFNYDKGIDVFRGICEAFTFLIILWHFASEMFQVIRYNYMHTAIYYRVAE